GVYISCTACIGFAMEVTFEKGKAPSCKENVYLSSVSHPRVLHSYQGGHLAFGVDRRCDTGNGQLPICSPNWPGCRQYIWNYCVRSFVHRSGDESDRRGHLRDRRWAIDSRDVGGPASS